MLLLGTSVLLIIASLILAPLSLILWTFHKHATRHHNAAWILQGKPIDLLRHVPGATLTSSWKTSFHERHWRHFSLYTAMMTLMKFGPLILPIMIRDGHDYGYGLPEAGSVKTWKTTDLPAAAELDEALALGEGTGAALNQTNPATFGAGHVGKRMYRGLGPQVRPSCRVTKAGDWDDLLRVHSYEEVEDQDSTRISLYVKVGCANTTATDAAGCPDWLRRYTKGVAAELVCFRENGIAFENDVVNCFNHAGQVNYRAVSVGNILEGNRLTTHAFQFSLPTWGTLRNATDWDNQSLSQPVFVSSAGSVACNFTNDIPWHVATPTDPAQIEVEPRALIHALQRTPPLTPAEMTNQYLPMGYNIVSSYLLASSNKAGIWVSVIERAGVINTFGKIYFLLVAIAVFSELARIIFWRVYAVRNAKLRNLAMPLDHRACMISLLWEQLELGMGCNQDVKHKLEEVKNYEKHYFGLTKKDLGMEHLGTGRQEKMVVHSVGAQIQGSLMV
ncbi:hypothetical protein HK097_006472 [Rhizophlyctis rosea]|uniref:Uncharacterized protein n=1 Tax=Rhizophlyctis rosea TaxID=64517 RepID=A0AAD5X2T7_9FUNG|nr:hypothetical protein HK097_006472 [Rhizophlyctis rosea]